MSKSAIIFFTLFFLTTAFAFAQKSRQQLEKEKRENLEKLQEVNGILKQTTTQKRANLGQLKAIDRQIETQNKKIDLLNEDIQLMDSELIELEKAKMALDNDLVKLKKEYAKMIYTSSKRSQKLGMLSFLFSAPSFNQLWARYKYLRQYTDEREKQATEIARVKQLMTEKTDRITGKKTDQQVALKSKVRESENLTDLKSKKSEVVKELSGREKELREELAEIKKANRDLENSITSIIRREIQERKVARERAAAKEREERLRAEKIAKAAAKASEEKPSEAVKPEPKALEPAPTKSKLNDAGMNEEEVALASSFSESRGRLPWPVKSGFISDHYGAHEYVAGLPITNDGINIQTNSGEAVRAVYDGVVVDIQFQGINHYVVFIQHGNFYTVYSKLKGVVARKGQKLSAKEPFANVFTDKDGTSEIGFQIWKDIDKMNPEKWLLPR